MVEQRGDAVKEANVYGERDQDQVELEGSEELGYGREERCGGVGARR